MRTLPRTLLAAIAVTALLAVPATGLAKPGGAYKGNTSQNRTLTFKVAGGKVKGFSGGITMLCSGSRFEFNAAIPPRAMKIRRGGKFSYKGRDRIDSTDITIRGKITRGKAKGTLRMTDSLYNSSMQSFVFCSGTAKFTAKRR